MPTSALFLDRDGVINIDKHYLHKAEEFEFTSGILKALQELSEHFLLFIITNQSGIGRGYFSEADYQNLTTWMLNQLSEHNIPIKKIYHCPHTPTDDCLCRKPKPLFVNEAIQSFDIDPKTSWFIGDKKSDLETGHNANIPNLIYINNGLHPINAPLQFHYSSTDNLTDITSIVLNGHTT